MNLERNKFHLLETAIEELLGETKQSDEYPPNWDAIERKRQALISELKR